MEIDSVAAGGALKPDGDRFRRDEEPRFLIGVGDYRCKEASQFTTFFQTTAYSGRITYINGGDFTVSAVVQVVGIILSARSNENIS
ncbi:hypothetical protein Bca52824_052852 [Brassica carinata]|uniref:Uncharacterized protein n=1 Tax=Brassica carinata TaxID=52824 RepID=A0A8X7R4S2_BRACI|nr:hypothetical protein Bca52824_052852 [Brassica carinata]